MAAIGDYEIGDELGQGPLGKIYKATQMSTGQTVVFRGFTKPDTADDALWAHCIRRYTEELTRAKALDHPNIASIYDFGALEHIYWVASEFFTGQALVSVLDAEGRKDLLFLTTLYEQLGSALDHALAQGLTHTDLTPYNILFLKDGELKVINFGLGQIREKWGSAYVAPEQVRSEVPDARSDVFALGVLGYECLAGDSPFFRSDDDATAAAVLADDPEPIPGVAEAPMQVLLKMLDKDPEERYENAAAAVNAFNEALKADTAPPPPKAGKAPKKKSRVVDHRPSLSHYNLEGSDARTAIDRLRARLSQS